MSASQFNRELLEFLQQSPTAFHAVSSMRGMLEQAGFVELKESDSWDLQRNKAYYVTHNDSAIIAFRTGRKDLLSNGVRMTGAHTDSPCLKVKPNPDIENNGYAQIGAEVYGGALYSPWFDRDLSLAGRVNFQTRSGAIKSTLINISEPIAIIPSLAIHLFRGVHEGRSINPQKELCPVVQLSQSRKKFKLDDLLLSEVKKQPGAKTASKILAHELYFYDSQSPSLVGLNKDFIASARLDNLLSCFVACRSLINSKVTGASLLVCNDHEEVGSASTSGAQGPFLKSVLQRLVASESSDSDALLRLNTNSTFLSIDNAHGVHPNYIEKHDDKHRPLLNGGPVIKLNANQRYASNSESVAKFKSLCEKVKVPYQAFAMRNDMGCGSTIGPITATETGINTVDIGVATFAMHSIRELAGAKDPFALAKVVTAFYQS